MHPIWKRVKYWIFKPRISSSSEPSTTQPVGLNEPEIEMRTVLDGTVTIVDNHFFVTDPDTEGSFATITVPRDGRLTVAIDGQRCVGRVIVNQELGIHVSMAHIPPSRKFSVRVSKDSMEVVGKVEVMPGVEHRLKDFDHVRHAVLELEGQEIYSPPFKFDDIAAQVISAGYHGNLDNEALKELCHATQTKEMVVLRGIPAIPGKPARYKPVKLPKIYDPVHRRMRISTIPIGTTVAVLEPEIPGISGRDVFGKKVPCPLTGPLPVLGEGVVEVNGRVVAVRNGRFLYTRSRIDVVPELVISHDLSSKDGKIEFDGNVIILGSVIDGSFIKATGSVEVHGGVLCSTVMGEQGVFVANAIVGSQIVAGQSKLLYMNLYPVVKRCLTQFDLFRVEHRELVHHAKKRSDHHSRLPLLADILLVNRHPNLERSLTQLTENSDHLIDVDDRYRQIVLEIRTNWSGIGRTNLYEQDVMELQQLLKDYVVYVESMMTADSAEVKAASVTSSSIRSSGKISITGAGVYASSFDASDSIAIKGTVRGGFLVAKNSVRIHELGTPSGTETSVKVLNPSGKIGIRIRHSNTLLQVGSNRDRNQVTEYNTVCRGGRHAHSNISHRRLA